ncbi:MAG: hypothetical protein IKP73_18505 [Bacteroidales bacterium]|nr:hypothetical protein [Bacteroidales bacterium]
MLTSAGDFTASESNRISSENLYDKTYTLNPKVVRLQAGKNTFRWEVSKNQLPGGNGCSNYKDVNVYYLPVQVEAGDPQFLCTNYGALQGSMSEVTFTNIEDIRWEKEWTTNSGAVIEDPENLYSPVTNLAATWNKFTLHAIVYHKDQLICDASDDVIIWNDDVGDVNAGQDDVDCGTVTNGGKLDGSYQSYIGEYHSLTADVSHLLHNGIGVKGEWSVIGGGVDQIEFGDRYSNVTSVKNLQRYMQDCTEGYWSQQGVSNQFRWTVTYTNPETGHTCSKYDDVQITWLAPGDPDAGEDQLVCSDYVDLAPGDQGCGAEKTWWAFPGSAANSGMNVDESKWSNPYWGGNSYLVADQRDLLLDETEKKKMVAAYGLEEATWNKKDRLVYSDVSYLDGRYYRIQSVRQTYKNSSGSIIYVDVSYAAYECEADGKVAGKDVKQEILDTDNATAVNPENYGKQLSLYQIADEVSNVAIYAQPTPANKEKLNSVNFRWYKNNQLYSPKKGYVVSCTSWDEVKIDYLGGMMDVFAGNEQVVCAENETVHLDATDRGVTFDITKTAEITVDGVTKDVPYSDKNPNYRIYLLGNAWEVVEGAGTFTNKSSKSTIVTNLGMGTNIYRWTATLMVEGKTGTTDIPLQQCTSTDDVYVTNASPSQAAVGDDREECSEITSISANLPVRSTGSFWVAEAGGAYITKQEIKDQQVSAYVTNMKLGVNTFTFHVLNYYESPKNPEVAKVCESTASISLYYHKLPADAGFDQFICVDEVTLKGNDLSITFEDDGKTVASCGFAEKGSFGPLDRDADGYITRLPHGKWYQAMTNDQYFYKASDPDSEASIGSTSVSNVIVKPLSHDFNKFHWQVTWGNCVSEDEVDVYVNMPTPTPNAGLDRATCSDEIDLAANNANNKGRQEWRSLDKNGVTLAPADEMSCHVSGLSSGLDNTFYWAFYREKLDQYPGMLPDQLRKYLEEVKKYTQNVKKYTEYVGYLEDYNARLATYESEMTAYNEYVRKLKEYVNYVNCRGDKLKISLGYSGIEDPGDCETQYTQKTKPAEVQMPARLQEPPYVAAPVDTSASNTTAPWAGLGLWNYYVKLSQDAAKADPSKYEKVYAREGEGVIQGEKLHEKDGMYYLECYMEDDVVIHSNSISVKASDYAACDYFVIKDDGKSTETSNNVFVTCANKDAIINSHSVGRREHSLETTSVGFSPAVNPEALQTGFTGKRGTATTERAALRERLSSEAVSGIGVTRDVDYSKYGVLWTQISGPKDLTIEGAATMFPKVSDAVDGSYEFQVYAVRMNGPTDYCESTQKVKVDIHIPTMAVLEARYQGIGDWTINRVAMCNDEIDLQWMSATGITFTPNSTLEEGSTLAPGKINEVPNNTEYSILRLVNGDGGGNSITFSKNSYVSGTPGRSEYKASGLPYNGTGFELFNCINYIDRNGKQQYCATSDTIPIFNNSVYADADVRIDHDKSQKGYQWVKQEVNICEDTYELEANDPHGFDGNKDLVQYETYGMWGFDDKDFKGYYVGEMPLLDGTSLYGTVTKFNPTATNLVKSDNHQRPNAFIWCVYKSIIPPYCKKDDEDICNNTMPENTYAPMYVYCADGKTYKDFYENDNGRIYWYPTDDKGNLVTNGDRYFQVAYTTKCDDVVRYGYIKTGTQPVACDADNKNIINATYVINKKELTGASICINFADLVDLRKEAQYGILPNDIYDMSGCKSEVENVSPKRCNKFYMQDDIENASGEIADKMRRWNAMSYLRNSSGGISVTNGQYRHQYNYYVTMNDNDEYVYLWSDRETHGKPTGGIEYECVATDGTISKTLLTYKDNGYDGLWGYTYFKGADMLYVSPERKTQFMLENTFQKDGKTCYPLAYDGGWKRDAPKVDKSGSNKSYYSDFTRGLASYPDWKQCVLEDNLETHTPIKSGNCGLCSGTFHVFFVTSAIGNYGEPIKIPLTFLKEYNGVRAKFFEEDEIPKGIQGVTFDNTYEKEDATYFACKKGDVICNESREGALAYDVPKMPGYKYAYHVSGWRWDDDAIRAFGADIQQDISHNIAEKSEPIQSTATNVDEIKEETDNPNKNYWCTARDTVFIYNNQFVVEENMPYFVVCSDEAQLKGEEPGGAAEANASGYWTVETNKEDVTIESPSNFVTNVTGLPPGETQFKWHLTRWTCNADKDVFVYYNKVESEAGDDVYTCSDEATLGAVDPQSPATGHWRVTESTGSKTTFDNINKFDATVSKLKQGDNPFVWVVENPMPPMQQKLDENGDPVYDADGNPVMESSGKIDGRTYHIQKKCTAEDQMMVHDLRPDDAIINTGKEITPNPSPRP